MKIILVICSFLFFSNGFCQNLSLKKIIHLENDEENRYNFLIEKKWKYLAEDRSTKTNLGSVTFIYDIKGANKNEVSFLTFLVSNNLRIKRTEVQINNVENYKKYIKEAKLLGFKYVSTTSDKKETTKIYHNNKSTIQFIEHNSDEGSEPNLKCADI